MEKQNKNEKKSVQRSPRSSGFPYRRMLIGVLILSVFSMVILGAGNALRGKHVRIKAIFLLNLVKADMADWDGKNSGVENVVPQSMPVVKVTYPLKVSSNGRYLVDQNDQPFLLSGDSVWSLIAQLTQEDALYYLANRQQKGFNAILVNLIEHQFAANVPENIYGDAPFIGKPFVTPNEAYFAHVDDIIDASAQHGILVLLDPLYLGIGCGDEGWCSDVKSASTSDLQAWGKYVGSRYRNFDNIIWVIGGDADPAPVMDKMNAFVAALEQADGRHLITAHNQPESMAVTPWHGETWLSVNNIYTYNTALYQNGLVAYNYTPTRPYFLIESTYENTRNSTPAQLRAQAYWTLLSGGMGYVFGNCPLWALGATGGCDDESVAWKDALNSSGSIQMMHFQNLFNSLTWYELIPDWNHTVLTDGYGTWLWNETEYAMAASSADGSLIVVYQPTDSTLTIDMTKLSEYARARWYDPTDGSFITVPGSPFRNTGTQQFAPPGNNSEGENDWVLVLDIPPVAAQTAAMTGTPLFPSLTTPKKSQ